MWEEEENVMKLGGWYEGERRGDYKQEGRK